MSYTAQVAVVHGRFAIMINKGSIVPDNIRDDLGLTTNELRHPVLWEKPIKYITSPDKDVKGLIPVIETYRTGVPTPIFASLSPGDEVGPLLGITRNEENQDLQ